MTSLSLQPNNLATAETVASTPILFAFVIGSIPVLIPVLLFRWLLLRIHRS